MAVHANIIGKNESASEIRHLLHLYRSVEDIISGNTMPDEAMNALVQASGVLGDRIVDAPAVTASDAADKFRFLAMLIEDEAGVDHDAINDVLNGAKACLEAVQRRQNEELRLLNIKWSISAH